MSNQKSFDAYRLGCPKLDRDHEILSALVNRLEALLTDNRDPQGLNPVVVELGAYFDAHFENEEELMEAIAFPALGEHREEHRSMQEQFKALVETIRIEDNPKAAEMIGILKEWMSSHINGTDQRLADHLDSGEAGAATGTFLKS